jgi:hypothetical protein
MRDKAALSKIAVTATDKAGLILEINDRLKTLADIAAVKGITPLDVTPQSIDVGSGATDRGANLSITITRIDGNNPANATGTLDTWEIWVAIAGANVEVATFYIVSGTNFSTRDSEAIGSVSSGSKQTFTGKSTDIETSDYVGIYGTSGFIETDTSGGAGIWYDSGDNIPCTNNGFTALADRLISLYATGTETASGWANIKNIRAGTGVITATDLSHIWFGTTAVAVADIAEFNGVAV